MNMINRHNYEEFFLMYVDNELPASECAAVELFVQQNPDLRNEFEMLLQTKLIDSEHVEFKSKNELLKIKDKIDVGNYQEHFLLYIDGELNEDGRESVERFVLQHPEYQDEFTLLERTVLPLEKIHYPDKKLLYRPQEKRTFRLYLLQTAVAAALTGVIALGWWLLRDVTENDRTLAGGRSVKHAVIPRPVQENSLAPVVDSEEQKGQVAVSRNIDKIPGIKTKPQKQSSRMSQDQTAERIGKIEVASNSKNSSDGSNESLPVDLGDNKLETIRNDEPILADIISNDEKAGENPLEKAKLVNAVNTPSRKTIIQPIVYKELNTDDVAEHDAFYIGNMELNKNKVRGLIKKVGGMFAGKSKDASDEKGKIQIASFELNTN